MFQSRHCKYFTERKPKQITQLLPPAQLRRHRREGTGPSLLLDPTEKYKLDVYPWALDRVR